MLVEITETCRQTENLNYPCEHLTVGFISEEQLQALARQAGLHLPIPTERESLMRNAVSVSENAFWCVLHLINPGQILGQRDKIGLLIVKNCFLVVDLFDELLTLNRYYDQLININDHLEENSNDLFAEDELRSFTLLNDRILRYRDNVQLLRDRLTQTQQSYQAQLDYQLNKSMKTLSLVTTICLPLSLIAGWYGMNFTAMPELKWRYGYLYVIGLSAAVVSLVIVLLKRKKG